VDTPKLPPDHTRKQKNPDLAPDLGVVNKSGTVEGLIAQPGRQSEQPTVTLAPNADMEIHDFLAPSQEAGELGRLGSYRILKVIGSGGMGVVFEAEDLQLGRPVALKVMKAAGPAAGQRFQREARSMAAVRSDHVVTIYQVGEDRGAPYLAMELLRGQSVDRWLARGHKPDTAEILRLGREVALGLAAAHERGLIHRDVKPGNIWLEAQTGRVKLLDFGLARAVAEDVQLTASGAVVGTPAYMAPEQARGDTFDHRADLFSLGVVLYRLATGVLPFRGESTMAVLSALATENPKPVRQLAPDMPRSLADLIMNLLAKDPAGRPETAKDVVAAIQTIERDSAIPAHGSNLHGHGAAGLRRQLFPGVAAAVLIVALGSLVWFFGTTIIRVITDKGELVIVVDDPDVEVIVKPDGVRIQSGKEKTLIVTAGDGVVEVRDPANGWTLVTEKFTLKRGGKEVVHITQRALAQARNARGQEKVPLAALDKEKPFVVVHKGERISFKTFAEAIGQRKMGGAIEVHGNGPFAVPAADVDGGGLILRAAPGYRPVFVAQIDTGARRPWMAVGGGEVVVEGCDFHSNTVFSGWFFDSGPEPNPAAPWTFRNCCFWVNGARGLIACAASRLRLEDSLVSAAFSETLLSLGLRVDLEMTNNLVHLFGPNAIVAPGSQTLRLADNYVEGGPAPLIRPPTDEAPARPVTILADGNIFVQIVLLGNETAGMPSEKVTRAQVKWEGNNNLYVCSGRPFASFAQNKRELKSLQEWNQFWGRPEPGSLEVSALALQNGAFSWLAVDAALRFVRSEGEALSKRLGDVARHVGPEWDLVGPGTAYVKALERTAGSLLPTAKLRPAVPGGGPFVLLSSQDEPRGHATLQSALDAVRDGDTIEVRSDGHFAGAKLQKPQRAGLLIIRAAPGYQPVFNSTIQLSVPKAEVQIEGLTIVDAHLTGEFGRLTMRNCAMSSTKEFWTLTCVLHDPGQAARFLGCAFNIGPDCRVGRGQSVLIENCVVSRTNVNARPGETDYEVILRQSLCWAGGLGNGCLACDMNANSQPRIRAEDCFFVGGGVLAGSAGQARWNGKHNIYGLTVGFAVFQQLHSLPAWQKRWSSDHDSAVAQSPFLEPRMWRVLPGNPKRPDGKDFGPDVDRVARTPARSGN
jgi:hypothetical protein